MLDNLTKLKELLQNKKYCQQLKDMDEENTQGYVKVKIKRKKPYNTNRRFDG